MNKTNYPWPIPLGIALATGIFALDLSMPPGAAAGVLYVVVVAITWWLPDRRSTLIAALAGTLLTILSCFYSPPGAVLWTVLISRSLIVLAIWTVAVFCMERKKVQQRLLEAERVRVMAETAGAAAHEINQYLMVLVGLTDILLRETAPDDLRHNLVEDLQEATLEIDKVVRKMLNVKRYATKLYFGETNIVDFDAAAGEDEGTGDA